MIMLPLPQAKKRVDRNIIGGFTANKWPSVLIEALREPTSDRASVAAIGTTIYQ